MFYNQALFYVLNDSNGNGDCMYVLLPNKSSEQLHTVNKVKIPPKKKQERKQCALGLKRIKSKHDHTFPFIVTAVQSH